MLERIGDCHGVKSDSRLAAHELYRYLKTAATRARPGSIWGYISERVEHGRGGTVYNHPTGALRYGWAASDRWLGTGSYALPL